MELLIGPAVRYIIDNYEAFPDLMVFIHGERYQWHNDDPTYGKSSTIAVFLCKDSS